MRCTQAFALPAAVLAIVLLGAVAAPAAQPERAAAENETADDRVPDEALGPVTVRDFKAMAIRPVRLKARHSPVYFRSPLAAPTACDRDVDANVPLACGAAMADWLMFTFRALGFPVEMALAPPWQTRPLGR